MAKVWFIGAGPGAADLLTVRAANALHSADIVIWASSLVTADVLEYARADAEIHDSKVLTLEEVKEFYRRAAADDLTVARVHSGDPALYGAMQEQLEVVREFGLDSEIVPGVTSVAATAAAAEKELTVPEVAQSVVFTRMATRTPMPDGETIRSFAAHGTTMALFLSASRPKKLQSELIDGGYAPSTPCVVGYRVSWPDEQLRYCRLDELAATIRALKVSMHTMVLIGPALASEGKRSHLYSPDFSHTHRQVSRHG
ncbi:precorrin-4 C(11)-methyltransferase [Haloglycomyces albus]|uniref:precorrin-4 C(11)-methyltransferase n=1 Tax=Haloglycomyces albus TaxID=526067 RepID=UPI00046D4AE1|nr:precorrin-4 C(11)-methyltransferase [Haloglycomyces albus]